jgi:hypothetical protein
VAPPTALRAIDDAIRAVRRLEASGLRTSAGAGAAPQLARLLEELAARRREVAEGGTVDRAWAGATVRRVAEWLPDEQLGLLARLGAIARASGPS